MTHTFLKAQFLELTRPYAARPSLPEVFWAEIEAAYTGAGRHYHNLQHLAQLWEQLAACPLQNGEAVRFALFYHDLVYDPSSNRNEEDSAAIARARLGELQVPAGTVAVCSRIIEATKQHVPTGDADTDLFTDADLSILGAPPAAYEAYAAAIREEYRIYADELYYPGRRKVLEHFLAMPQIFKTDRFRQRYEAPARRNLGRELEQLRG